MLSVALLLAPGAAQATTTGTPIAWGCGGVYGPCAVPDGLAGATVIAAGGDHGLALKGDGTVVAWGCGFNYGQCSVPVDLAGVTALAAGLFHSIASKADGTVAAWGCRAPFNYGQCSVPDGLSGVKAVAGGVSHSLALKDDGTVVAWGCIGIGADVGQCSVPEDLAGVTAISASTRHSLALKSDGTVVAWGCGAGSGSGQCSVPADLSGVTAISAGHAQSLALKSDGTVVAWGCDYFNYGQCNVPASLAAVTAISAGYAHSLALKEDGTVVAWGCVGDFDFGQCNVPAGLAGVTAIDAGDRHSLALTELVDQTITFGPLPDRTWGDPGFVVSATASSDLPVSFTASGACFLSGPIVFATSAGSCTVTASQPGGLNFNPAPAVSRTFTIARLHQSIIFAPLETKRIGDPDFVVSAFSGSGLPVSFAANGNCAVSGVTVHLTGAGSCTITASQAGGVNWEPAPDVSQTFAIERAIHTTTPAPPCRVPAVVGKRLVSAKRMIGQRRCRTGKVGYAYSRKRKRGIVVSQSRRPERLLPAGSKINLIVSRGRRR